MRATNAAAWAKSSRFQALPARKSISPWSACCETAIAGIPNTMPSSAAATVPEYVMSSPRLEPWLMPDTISSGSKSIRPRAAKRTQSTGVPSVANPLVPSPNSTSSTHSGWRVVMLRAVAERFESGAITASSTPGISSSAWRIALRPVALMPSSFVSRTFMKGGCPGYSVADRLQVKAVGRRGPPRLAAGPSLQEPREPVLAPAFQHRSDQHAHHVAHERVRLDHEGQHVLTLLDPFGPEHVAGEAHMVGVGGRERREVVRPGEGGGVGVKRGSVERAGPPQRATPLEGAWCPAGQQPVPVGAALRMPARVETVRCGLAGEHGQILGQQAVE